METKGTENKNKEEIKKRVPCVVLYVRCGEHDICTMNKNKKNKTSRGRTQHGLLLYELDKDRYMTHDVNLMRECMLDALDVRGVLWVDKEIPSGLRVDRRAL